MIEITNLRKSYKLTKKQLQTIKNGQKVIIAVNNISLKMRAGEIFGLLGPNGAGKTTTLRCIATLIKPTDGTVRVGGYDVVDDASEVRKNIAFLTNELRLDKHFTVDYTADFYGSLYGLSKERIHQRKRELFELFDMEDFVHKKVGELSTGMMQKLSIVISVIHDPEIIIFDEPTNGLDIITARRVLAFLKAMKDKGKTVVISTHIMDVAEKLCDRLAIILDGEVHAEGTCDAIAAEVGEPNLEEAFFTLYQRHELRKQVNG